MPKSEETLIRVNGRDDWFSGITHAVRSRYVLAHKGEDKAVAKEKEIARRLYDTVRDTLKAAVGEAKAEHKKVTKKTEFPAFIKVGFGSSVLTVSSNMQSFIVQIDKECHEWISGNLVEEIEQRIHCDISSEEPEADQPSTTFTFAKAITGIRTK